MQLERFGCCWEGVALLTAFPSVDISDCPAWLVTKANQYAHDHGLRPFILYQGRRFAAKRDVE